MVRKWYEMHTMYLLLMAVLIVFVYNQEKLLKLFSCVGSNYKGSPMLVEIHTLADVVGLFPKTAADIQLRCASAMEDTKKALNTIIAIPAAERTFENTAKALDNLDALSSLIVLRNTVSILEMVSPDKNIRTAAHEAVLKMQNFMIDEFINPALYQAFKTYKENTQEQLSEKQQYYIQETLKGFQRSGLDLPVVQQEQVKELKKSIAALELSFDMNIAQDASSITVDQNELAGIDAHTIASLKQDEQGLYIVGVDYPTYSTVMENCTVESTREKIFKAYNNRAYPVNDQILKEVIAQRDALAHLLGFASYAAFEVDDQMVQSVERVKSFLDALVAQVAKKVADEVRELSAKLPAGVSLTKEGKFKPWDVAFIKNQYKKKYLTLDEKEIAEYFPLEQTIQGLLSIYERFFSLRFKEVATSGTWHDTVTGIEVYDSTTDQLLGYLLLDLFPRADKYSHACHITIIPATYTPDGKANKAVSLVITNFPHPTDGRPSLLERKYVETFFHEFGHALHALLGRTQLASLAGTSVKHDFVEMPSQMLEEWLWDADILRMISGHYKTGAKLPEQLIKKIIAVKNFDTGSFVERQSFFALLSLALFGPGAQKDPAEIMKNLYEKIRTSILFSPDDHMYASFGHLMGYGAKYYGYLWSKVFALDLFTQIKKEGLLNPVIGAQYRQEVIGQGGSKDPNELLEIFLGRKPNQDAFLMDLGIN